MSWRCLMTRWLAVPSTYESTKANKKASAVSHLVVSRYTALVEAHVNRHTYVLTSSPFASFSVVYKELPKSTPVCVKGGSSETRSSGKLGDAGSENGVLSTFLHVTHFRTILLTVCLPRIIHKRPLSAVNEVFTPLYSTRS